MSTTKKQARSVSTNYDEIINSQSILDELADGTGKWEIGDFDKWKKIIRDYNNIKDKLSGAKIIEVDFINKKIIKRRHKW